MADPPQDQRWAFAGIPPKWLLGRVSEHADLSVRLRDRPGLLVLEADPLSGTSGVIMLTLEYLDYPNVYVDARGAGDAMDLAMLIADAAVQTLRPAAAPSWFGDGVPGDVEGLRLARTLLAHRNVHLEDLRLGVGGRALDRLREALWITVALAEGDALLVIDHLDSVLESITRKAAEELLAVLRAERQSGSSAELLLVGRPQGRLIGALQDPEAALFHAGQSLRARRATPERVVHDLMILRPFIDLHIDTIRTAAQLAEGAPAIMWRILDLAEQRRAQHPSPVTLAQDAWNRLHALCEPLLAQQFGLLAATNRVAPTVLCALSHGVGPYELPMNGKTVRDALVAMRARGVVWSPEKGHWRVTDPLMGSWARQHSPPRVRRRVRGGT